MTSDSETTDLTLFVQTSGEEVARWNRRRIVEALIREALIDEATAEVISREVEKQIVASGISLLTTALIRELVDAKLIERGLEQARRMHARLGFPLYDVRQLILHRNKENANVPHGPEGTNLVLVEGIKREYALYDVFSREVGDAHVLGDFHLHGLGFIDRPYSACQSLEYLKRFGLRMPHTVTVAGPARHAEVLLAHMVRFGATLQGHLAGMLGWNAVNLSFAPYLSGMNDAELEQFAQMLIYEFSQLTSARGGQAIFTDIHLYWEVPDRVADLPAIGPGGQPTGRPYREYGNDARKFALALLATYRRGDALGRPFVFPRPIFHITDALYRTEGHEAFLEEACGVAAAMGNPCFVLDREGGTPILACGGLDACKGPECSPHVSWGRCRFSIQNITLNLPRLGYRSGDDEKTFFPQLDRLLELAAMAHLQKKAFIEKLLALGDKGPLATLAMEQDGTPYLKMSDAVYTIGIVGLNELVQVRTGRQLHESEEALEDGLRIMDRLREQIDGLGSRYGIPLLIEQTPAETTAYRFARLDLKHFSPLSGRYVRGDLARGEIYYTNSSQLHPAAPLDPWTRVQWEGRFHPFFRAGAATPLELGAARPEATDLARFVGRAFRETQNNQIVFSTEFTACHACASTSRGLLAQCPFCGSAQVDGLARISQYLSWVSSWNRGKRAELRDRRRQTDFLSF